MARTFSTVLPSLMEIEQCMSVIGMRVQSVMFFTLFVCLFFMVARSSIARAWRPLYFTSFFFSITSSSDLPTAIFGILEICLFTYNIIHLHAIWALILKIYQGLLIKSIQVLQ